jgi:hypothetical protein
MDDVQRMRSSTAPFRNVVTQRSQEEGRAPLASQPFHMMAIVSPTVHFCDRSSWDASGVTHCAHTLGTRHNVASAAMKILAAESAIPSVRDFVVARAKGDAGLGTGPCAFESYRTSATRLSHRATGVNATRILHPFVVYTDNAWINCLFCWLLGSKVVFGPQQGVGLRWSFCCGSRMNQIAFESVL